MVVQAARLFECGEAGPVVCQLPVRFSDVAECRCVGQGKPGLGEDRRGGLVRC